MEIISYGAASKAVSMSNKSKKVMGGSNATGNYSTVKERIDAVQDKIGLAYKGANDMIIQNAINMTKAELKLNTILKMKKYEMNQMVIDDLLDKSGIVESKSRNYTYDAVRGLITAQKDCVIQLQPLTANKLGELIFSAYKDTYLSSDENIALGKQASGTSGVSVATDGIKYGNYAYTNGAGEIVIDLEQIYNIDEVVVYWYYGDNRTYYNTKLKYSTDKVSWTTLELGNFKTTDINGPQVVKLNGAAARYIASYGAGNTMNVQTHWFEVEVYGDGNPVANYELEYSIDEINWIKANPEDITYLKENKGTIHLRMLLAEGETIGGYGYVYN